eukprot:6389573-Pyramimonas_sp.AAC.1
MHRTAEVIVHGRRLGTCVITQEKELSVMKWMMWQLKPCAIQRREAKDNITKTEEKLHKIEGKISALKQEALYEETMLDYYHDLFREAAEGEADTAELSSTEVDIGHDRRLALQKDLRAD